MNQVMILLKLEVEGMEIIPVELFDVNVYVVDPVFFMPPLYGYWCQSCPSEFGNMDFLQMEGSFILESILEVEQGGIWSVRFTNLLSVCG